MKKEIIEGIKEFLGSMFWYIVAFLAIFVAVWLYEGLFYGF